MVDWERVTDIRRWLFFHQFCAESPVRPCGIEGDGRRTNERRKRQTNKIFFLDRRDNGRNTPRLRTHRIFFPDHARELRAFCIKIEKTDLQEIYKVLLTSEQTPIHGRKPTTTLGDPSPCLANSAIKKLYCFSLARGNVQLTGIKWTLQHDMHARLTARVYTYMTRAGVYYVLRTSQRIGSTSRT